MPIPFFSKEKSVDEELEDIDRLKAKNERMKLEYSNIELQNAIKKSKEAGISNWRKTFSSPSALLDWFRHH